MISGLIDACWHPSGVRVFFDRILAVSPRSTPGYLLSSLRDEKTDFCVEMVSRQFQMISGIINVCCESGDGVAKKVEAASCRF
jgi:hypothetical protein